jgi:hypothetical protein
VWTFLVFLALAWAVYGAWSEERTARVAAEARQASEFGLSDQDRLYLVETLKKFGPRKAKISWFSGDPTGKSLADDFYSACEILHWRIEAKPDVDSAPFYGISLRRRPDDSQFFKVIGDAIYAVNPYLQGPDESSFLDNSDDFDFALVIGLPLKRLK